MTLAARASLERIIIIAGRREEGRDRKMEARGRREKERESRRGTNAEERKRRFDEDVKEERNEAEEKGVGCEHVDPSW